MALRDSNQWSDAVQRARQRLRERSVEDRAARLAQVVALNPRPLQIAHPAAQLALALLEDDPPVATRRVRLAAGRHYGVRIEAELLQLDAEYVRQRMIPQDLAASWGDLRVIVDDAILTTNDVDGQRRTSVRWFLLPFVEWLVEEWHDIVDPPVSPDGAGRSAGEPTSAVPLPHIELLRWVHRIRVDARPRTLVWPQVRFVPPASSIKYVDPSEAAAAVRDFCVQLSTAIDEVASSATTRQLVERSKALRVPEKRIDVRVMEAPLPRSVEDVKAQAGAAFEALMAPLRHRPSPLRLAYGSASPNIAESDVRKIYDAVAQLSADEPMLTGELKSMRESKPVRAIPWKDGQQLARSALDGFGVDLESPVDVEELLEGLGVPVQSIELTDPQVRGLVAGYPEAAPAVFCNTECTYNRTEAGRRFTLAHELCHVLFDQGATRAIGIIDGDWAPYGVEARANAFAAMFLMPPEVLLSSASRVRGRLTIERLAAEVGASMTATRKHLENLRTIGALDDAALLALLDC